MIRNPNWKPYLKIWIRNPNWKLWFNKSPWNVKKTKLEKLQLDKNTLDACFLFTKIWDPYKSLEPIWDATVADTLRNKSFITILKIHPLWYTSCFVFLYHNGCIFKFENTPVVVYCSIFFSIPQRVYFENTPVEVY